MKKLICILLVLCCLASLCSCAARKASNEKPIVYGEKYILSTELSKDDKETQDYYIFDEEYLKYYVCSSNKRIHHMITYKYSFIDDESVVYFFDSIEIYDDDKKTDKYSIIDDEGILIVSENVILKSNVDNDPNDIYDMYVRESYGDGELKNFGRT